MSKTQNDHLQSKLPNQAAIDTHAASLATHLASGKPVEAFMTEIHLPTNLQDWCRANLLGRPVASVQTALGLRLIEAKNGQWGE